MKHWFVRFLESNGQVNLERAQRYREAIKGETEKARSLREAFDEGEEGDKQMLWEADRFEQVGHRYLEWARLAEDMIECGMEEQAIRYYSARKSTGKERMIDTITRENWDFTYNSHRLREEMESITSSEKQEAFSQILSAFGGLYTVGLQNHIIDYYQRKRTKYPELNLPEPIIHEEFDEEERATGRMKS